MNEPYLVKHKNCTKLLKRITVANSAGSKITNTIYEFLL